MKKKLVCSLLALATAASMSVAASAQSITADASLLEKVFAKEDAHGKQDLSAMIRILNAAAQQPFVVEHIWYDEAGN